jgi:hypothetical protein
MTDVITGVKKIAKKTAGIDWFYQQVIVLVKNIILSTNSIKRNICSWKVRWSI